MNYQKGKEVRKLFFFEIIFCHFWSLFNLSHISSFVG